MKRLTLFSFALVFAALFAPESIAGQRRRVVVRPARPARVVVRRPVTHTRLVVRNGHPIRRVLPSTVVVRPARKVVTLNAPVVYLPARAWNATVVSLPSSDRVVWEDSEEIHNDEGWVDTNLGVDNRGKALFIKIDGLAQLSFAEVVFGNGSVQVVDFNDSAQRAGVYNLLDFSDGRHVSSVRLLAKSSSDDSKLTLYLRK
ncbi:MAG TPA: hypothetical protein VEW46_15555 [Pyrinomonadaceae bacterium]|nr:hypothetical protein [Pyrinomonadaceae bacterium]